MAKETNYGIISDIHTSSPLDVTKAIKTLKRKGADKLIFNGDIVGDQNDITTPINFLSYFSCLTVLSDFFIS